MNSINTTTEQNLSVTSAELQKWLKEEKEVFILDVRPEEERREWSIPESDHADIYEELKSDAANPFEGVDLPEDRPVVTVCGAGKTSLTAAEKLRERNIEAYSLEGGMKAWNFAWDAAEMKLDENLTLLQVRRLAKGCLSYMIGSGNEAVVIDASLDPEVYIQRAEERGWTITRVMDTHLHADYVSRTRELAEATGADHLLYHTADVEYSFTPVEDKQSIPFGNHSITTLHTPGHTPESVSFILEGNAVFTGDTLFTDGVGRPDLKANRQEAERKAEQLYESLQKLLQLEEDTKVLPAHTAESVRIGDPVISSRIQILSDSVELLSLPKKEFIRAAVSRIPPTPSNYQTISTINRTGDSGGYKLEDLEAGANRCAVS